MLTRSSQIGEFYVMSPPQVYPGKNAQHSCDILIFDEEADRHVRVTWADALAACCIAQAGGEAGEDGAPGAEATPGVAGTTKMSFPTDKMAASGDLKAWFDEADKWAKATADDAPELTEDAYKGYDKDIRIVVARPFIEHLMHNVIMTVSGRDTGATLFGPADMQLSANTQVKTIEGHCEFGGRSNPTTLLACACALTASPCLGRHGPLQGRDHEAAERAREFSGRSNPSPLPAHSYQPRSLPRQIMRDVACAGYVAGCNATFFTKNGKTHDLGTGRESIQARLSFADDVGAKYGSMLAFPCTEQQFSANQGLDTVMSVTSRLLPWEVTGVNARNHSSFPGGEAVYQVYNRELGLDSVHYGEDMKAAGLRRRLEPCPLATPADRPLAFVPLQRTRTSSPRAARTTRRERTPHASHAECFWSHTHTRAHAHTRTRCRARRCFLGPHRKFDPFTANFMSLVPGQGQCAAALKPHARLSSACARTHSPRAPRSFAQLRPRRDSGRCALAQGGIGLTQSGQGQHGVARVRCPASQTRALRGHAALG